MFFENRITLGVAETVEAIRQIIFCHFLINVEDVDRCLEWGSAEDATAGCCRRYEVED